MEDISCIFCKNTSNHIAITENGYTGRKCQACNLIFISPRPNAAEIENIYTDHQAVKYADAHFQFEQVKRKIAASTLSKIRTYREKGSLLEIGPGGGFFLQEARNYGYAPYGIEPNPIEARLISEKLGIPCANTSVNAGSFGGKQFDVIYHDNVLSHFYDPIGAFSDMNRILKKDGLLVFATGNIADVDEKYYKMFSQFLYPDHLFFFGEHSLKLLLEQTGFRCICIYREVILLQLLLQRFLWNIKELLKDKQILEGMKSDKHIDPDREEMSIRRRLRLLYRHVGLLLIKIGVIFPKNGAPMRLLVVAEKM